MKKLAEKKFITKQERELAAQARLPDTDIDLTDMPEVRDWKGAAVW